MDLVQLLYSGCPGVADIPDQLIDIVSTIVTIMKFGIPLLLIIFGMLDLGKAVMASKEDEIKKGQQLFIKRVIAAVIAFFVVFVVQLVVNVAASGNEASDIWECVNVFVNGRPNAGANQENAE